MRGCLRKAKTQKRGLPPAVSSWDIILAMGRGADGKHKQKWIRFHGTQKQADQKVSELVGEVYRGEFIEPSKLTLGEWLDTWLETAIAPPRCTANTYLQYRSILENHLKPALGQFQIQKLAHLQIQRVDTRT